MGNEPEEDCFITILIIQRYFKTIVVRKNMDGNSEDLSRRTYLDHLHHQPIDTPNGRANSSSNTKA